jgi:TPR repeat protein
VPAVLSVRYVAANTFLALPGMFNRGERGHKLLDEVLKSPLFEASPAGFKASVWLRAGQQAVADQQPAQARQWYEKAAASGTPQAAQARTRLQAL